jgi:hypothetical protein
VLGRPIGLDAQFVAAVADRGVHVHFHGLTDGPGPQGGWRRWLDHARRAAPGHVHVHPGVDQRGWVERLSRYDAGWMHRHPDGRRAADAAAAQPGQYGRRRRADRGHRRGVALRRYADVDDLGAALAEPDRLARARDRVAAVRDRFTFDAHTGTLIALLERVSGRS